MFREWNGMEYRWIIYEAISVHEIRPRVLRSGSIGTVIKRSVSDGASMDASWTSNGCSPLRRTYTTRIAHRFLETLLTRTRLEARHSSPNCVQLAPKLFFLPIITCACIYIYICISLRWLLNDTIVVGWRDRAARWNGLNSSLKVSPRDLYCYGCVFVRLIVEGSMLNRSKCIAIAKLFSRR